MSIGNSGKIYFEAQVQTIHIFLQVHLSSKKDVKK